MKTGFVSMIVAASAIAVSATNTEAHFYLQDDCKNEVQMTNHVLAAGDCIQVTSGSASTYSYVRKSHVDNEALLFATLKECEYYPEEFDRDLEVAFIRSNIDASCVPCVGCHNVKSVLMKRTDEISAKATDPGAGNSNSATTASVSVASMAVVAVAAAFLA
ncbi:hypothetical protein SARC_07642 [Sphaeroforma arctica JP610]|uniref:Uncharacterized protein n=1 Tax=Sphaeroforma arctica JP610 TaxID=667725 RepID=A0A0L0FT79_9EUKA|nr:hypothetical protein SARC_07642 [Sphaeroforma arctica JP610]KNC79987.1 hypothetical protein SARC_07642 [Sphaeroforma arctica JP610]|eukprot:XP_014153889.1 hypothetical protein SARC_07642 [Sphaeroforma arctica JP610]